MGRGTRGGKAWAGNTDVHGGSVENGDPLYADCRMACGGTGCPRLIGGDGNFGASKVP